MYPVTARGGGGCKRNRRLLHAVVLPWLLSAAPVLAQSAPPATPAADKAPAEQELIYQGEATSILGRQLRGPNGEMVGRIVDVLVGETGLARAAVVEFGGFMGLGNRRVAVAWRALRFQPNGGENSITLDLTEDQIKAIPEFRRASRPADPPVTVAVPPRPDPAAAAMPSPAPSAPASPPAPTPPAPASSAPTVAPAAPTQAVPPAPAPRPAGTP